MGLQIKRHFNIRKVSKDHWMSLPLGTSKAHINVFILYKNNEVGIEINIPEDKKLYNKFYSHKENIEKETCSEFNWLAMEERKSSRIVIQRKTDFVDTGSWEEEFDWIIETASIMKTVFNKYM